MTWFLPQGFGFWLRKQQAIGQCTCSPQKWMMSFIPSPFRHTTTVQALQASGCFILLRPCAMLPHNWRQLVTANVICFTGYYCRCLHRCSCRVKKTVPNTKVTLQLQLWMWTWKPGWDPTSCNADRKMWDLLGEVSVINHIKNVNFFFSLQRKCRSLYINGCLIFLIYVSTQEIGWAVLFAGWERCSAGIALWLFLRPWESWSPAVMWHSLLNCFDQTLEIV